MGCAERIVSDIHDNPLIRRGLAFKTDAQGCAEPSDVAGPTVAGQSGTWPSAFHCGHPALSGSSYYTAVALLEAIEFATEQYLDVGKALQAFEHHASPAAE